MRGQFSRTLLIGLALLGCSCVLPPPPANFSLPACTSANIGQPVALGLSTGTGVNGPPPGQADPHWTGISPRQDVYSTKPGPWFAPSGGARWIQFDKSGTPTPAATIGYTYGIAFQLPQHPTTYNNLTITGVWGADDDGAMKLNGTTIASCTSCFGTQASIPILPAPIPPATSLFNNGYNLLLVDVTNYGGPSGLYVRAAVRATCP